MITHLAVLLIPVTVAAATRTALGRLFAPGRRHRKATRRNGTILTRPHTTPAPATYDYPIWAYRAALTLRAHLTRQDHP